MPQPVTKIYYCNTASFPGTTYGGLSENVAPPQTNTTWGWESGRNNPPLFSSMNWSWEVNRLNTEWQATPTQSVPAQNGISGSGDCWVYGPINGEFVPGQWEITMSIKSTTNAASHQGQMLYRIWTAPSGSGLNATLVTSSFITSSIATIASTTVPDFPSASFVLPQVNLRNEYLFVQTYWSIVTSPGGGVGNNLTDNNFILGTGSLIRPTAFVTHSTGRMVSWSDDGI